MRISGADLLDGDGWRRGLDVDIVDDRIAAVTPSQHGPRQGAPIICPAPIDLQVNGGGGRMLGDCKSPDDVLSILAAHRGLGTGAILPTLVSASRDRTRQVVDLVAEACDRDTGLLGLHLEGPHIAVAGAHDPAVLRPLSDADVADYVAISRGLPSLMITLAPECATLSQIERLAGEGIVVSLGHTACTAADATAAFKAGARMATHLFNAMSGLHHRAPGLVGAALTGAEAFGLIADLRHVAPEAILVALRARPDAAIPVSDAMAVAGTELASFHLDGRLVRRGNGCLTLEDGTLAGADLSLLQGLANLARLLGQPLAEVLPMGFDRPHRLLTGRPLRAGSGIDHPLLVMEGGEVDIIEGGGRRTVLHLDPDAG